MERHERIELLLILPAALTVAALSSQLPAAPSLGHLLLAAAVLLLAQGLLRDLWLLQRTRSSAASVVPRRLACLCVESGLGVAGVVAGLVLLGSGVDLPVTMSPARWGTATAAVLALGFVIRHWIIALHPLRLVRDADHLGILVRWR